MSNETYIPLAWDDLEGVIAPSETLNLVGHSLSHDMLAKNYKAGRLHHAWLVSGPRGIGKATMAYRFAEHLLRNPVQNDAPGHMQFVDDAIHSQVSKGAHPNVLVLRRPFDQKSKKFKTQITVDEVRRTAAFLHTASGANAWRIVIVDPADDMNTSAANALLKMLEEPPSRTVFMVLAHSPRGLLPTIRSRCQVLSMKALEDHEMRQVLGTQPISQELKPAEMDELLKYAQGSVRRAALLLDSGVLKTFTSFLEILDKSQPDIAQLHRLAGMIAPASKASEFGLFMDLVYDHLANLTRTLASNDQVGLEKLSRLAKVWERTQEANMRAETWNMDKKQVILDLFQDMRAA